jgi:hypothetical protein
MKKLFIFAFFTLLSVSAYSAGVWHSSNIKTIYPLANGSVVVTFSTPSTNCSNPDGYYYLSKDEGAVTQDGIDSMLSVLLVAASTGKIVNVYFNKDSSSCYINRLNIQY